MIVGITASLTIFMSRPAPAVEAIQLIYGPASISLEFQDLQTFAETGQRSNQLNSLFTLAELSDSQITTFRNALNFGVNVPTDVVNSLLGSSYGRLAVGAFSLFINPSSSIDNIVDDVLSALRDSTRDGRLTMLDVVLGFQAVDTITVDVNNLMSLYDDVSELGEQAIAFLKAQPEIRQLICN
ncbi:MULTISPECIES: alpha/beta hydrolase [Limnospira]|nr:alpha/beta hydrolase [Arthrospira platensis]MDT9181286.1 alpha/beta hydrolase [Limnospira sp. PMC 289.06]QQW29525.2 alpha/beta hydrolase [Arthrospira sp. PCC 9108]